MVNFKPGPSNNEGVYLHIYTLLHYDHNAQHLAEWSPDFSSVFWVLAPAQSPSTLNFCHCSVLPSAGGGTGDLCWWKQIRLLPVSSRQQEKILLLLLIHLVSSFLGKNYFLQQGGTTSGEELC